MAKVAFLKWLAFCACWVHCGNCVILSITLPIMMEPPDFPSKCNNVHESVGWHVSWSQMQQGYVLSGYGMGYFVAQLVSSLTVNILGARWVVFGATLMSGLSTMLLPYSTTSHWSFTLCLRVITGLTGGLICDAVFVLTEQWKPRKVRVPPRLVVVDFYFIISAGLVMGVCGTWVLIGVLMKIMYWTTLYIVIGAAGISWSIAWAMIVGNDTTENISTPTDNIREQQNEVVDYLPLEMILTSCPFIALAFLHYGDIWGITLFFLLVPKYIHEVLELGIFTNSLLCAGAVSFRFIVAILLHWSVKAMLKNDCLDVTSIRKLFVFFSHPFTGVTAMAIGYIGCSPMWMLLIFSFAMCLSGAATVTNEANAWDLSPTFVRTLFVCMHFVALTSTFILPILMGVLLTHEKYMQAWSFLFYLTAGVYIFTGLIFLLFGSGDVQPWNFPHLYLMAHLPESAMAGRIRKMTMIPVNPKRRNVPPRRP